MSRHLVIVGCGHAHLTVLLRVADFTGKGYRVTVVSPDSHHYYSGMGPGMLSGVYNVRQIRFHARKMAEQRGAAFLEGRAVRIDPAGKSITLDSGREVDYDIASFNTGSGIPLDPLAAPSERIIPVKPILNLYAARRRIQEELKVRDLKLTVVGGGPAGVEIAANLWRLAQGMPRRAEITLLGGTKVLGKSPEQARNRALLSLGKRGVRVLEGKDARAVQVAERELLMANGNAVPHDFAFMAMGVKPSTIFADSGLPTGSDGGLLVDSFLRSTAHPAIFGGGDCISLAGNPLDKVGVYAVRQNPVLYHNLMAALEGSEPVRFDPGGSYLQILNMGNGTGILWKNGLVWDGRAAFLLKDFIDRRFMKKFQVSGELSEPDGESS